MTRMTTDPVIPRNAAGSEPTDLDPVETFECAWCNEVRDVEDERESNLDSDDDGRYCRGTDCALDAMTQRRSEALIELRDARRACRDLEYDLSVAREGCCVHCSAPIAIDHGVLFVAAGEAVRACDEMCRIYFVHNEALEAEGQVEEVRARITHLSAVVGDATRSKEEAAEARAAVARCAVKEVAA